MPATRRPLPFVVPAEVTAHPAAGPIVRQFEDLVAKREAHIAANEQTLLDARDLVVLSNGQHHPAVAKLNSQIAAQSGLWV